MNFEDDLRGRQGGLEEGPSERKEQRTQTVDAADVR